jgi:hypothetical protein
MLSGFSDLISQFVSLLQWWVVIAPWEAAIRVRRGKYITVLQPGMHFRIPALDRFFVQGTRKRYMNTPTQTVTTNDGHAVTVSGGTAYSIADIGQLYNTLRDAEDVIQIETLALVAQYVATHSLEESEPSAIQGYVNDHLKLERYGLNETSFLITDFVCVRTYRIINSNPKDWGNGQSLSTQTEQNIGRPLR